jgi:hypothetical protein
MLDASAGVRNRSLIEAIEEGEALPQGDIVAQRGDDRVAVASLPRQPLGLGEKILGDGYRRTHMHPMPESYAADKANMHTAGGAVERLRDLDAGLEGVAESRHARCRAAARGAELNK